MNVISLFDGLSAGRIALDKLNLKVDNYYASEIDKNAIKIAHKNYPSIKHVGDVREFCAKNIKTDLLIGGSPCQGFSKAGNQLAFAHHESRLFFEYMRILEECNPKYFMLENVEMHPNHMAKITNYLGVKPIMINSARLSAQNRVRYYWTNIPNVKQPKHTKKTIKDIVLRSNHEFFKEYPKFLQLRPCSPVVSKPNTICRRVAMATDVNINDIGKRIYSTRAKSPCVTTQAGGNMYIKILMTRNPHKYRWLTPIENERLQTIPDDYTKGVSNSARYHMIGNSWTVDVISHIFKNLT